MKTLGESDDEDDSALAWINKSRKLQHEKEMAEKRVRTSQQIKIIHADKFLSRIVIHSLLNFQAKLLDAMDEEFGISDLMDEAFADTKKSKVSSEDMASHTTQLILSECASPT